MPFLEVKDTQVLQVGTFVKLEGSWFSHPFPTNTFKIKSQEDLTTIQGLTNVTILYDPDRSDSVTGPVTSEDPPPVSEADPFPSLEEAGLEPPGVEAEMPNQESSTPNAPGLIAESALSEILDRREDYQEFQEHLRKVEGAYQKILGQGQELFKKIHGRRPSGVKIAEVMVKGVLRAIENPRTAMSLIDLVGSNGTAWGLSEHALNVCTLALLMGKQLGLDEATLGELGRGALFHDVGYRALPMKVKFLSAGIKIHADPELGKTHPALGRQLMASYPGTPTSILDIIERHHERCDGSGYPQGLPGDQLDGLTRIVMVADHYDELCNAPDPQHSLNPHEALSRLYRHVTLRGESAKYCPRVVQALVQAIGVFPPGTLVELSDGYMGIVSSINIQDPTRPTVLLYAPWINRHDGMLVRLSKDPTLEIKRALHPKDVSSQVLAYLSPRRMAMFVHATETTTLARNSSIRRSARSSRRS